MLSICIPIFNFDVRALLAELLNQSKMIAIPTEICCLDDASSEFVEINQAFIRDKEINYEYLDENIGRARIRNRLAQFAQGDYLIYLDCDVKIGPDYIQKYIEHLSSGVVYGGTIYNQELSVDLNYRLHYLVGHQRESVLPIKRNQAPYLTFKTNNFLTPKEIILAVPFDNSIRRYGHEDTLWAFSLSTHDIPILHIDNPIIHLGLETNEELLYKIELALLNLLELRNTGRVLPVKALKYYQKYHSLLRLVASKQLLEKLRGKLLTGSSPLRILDFYKLIFLTINDDV